MTDSVLDLHQKRMIQLCSLRTPPDLAEMLVRETGDGSLNWNRLLQLANDNRSFSFIHLTVKKLGLEEQLPADLVTFLRRTYLRNVQRNMAFEAEVKTLLTALDKAAVPVIVMRGVVMSDIVFGNPAIRQINDIDILIRKKNLKRVKEVSRELGYGQDPRSLDDRYYERHHLHLPYLKPKRMVLLEIHWNYDHKYTPFNVDTNVTFDEAVKGEYCGLPCLFFSPEDLMIMLCLHAFKHSCSVKYTFDRPEAPGMVLAEGGFVQFLDLHYGVEYCRGTIDWEKFRERVEQWNLQVPVLSTLRVMEAFFNHDPANRVDEVPGVPPVRSLERFFFNLLSRTMPKNPAAAEPAVPPSRRGGTLYRKIDRISKTFFFNAARLFDISSFFLPGPAFLRQRYGNWPGPLVLLLFLWHLLVTIGQILHNLLDMVWYALKKQLSRKSAGDTAPQDGPPR